MAENERKLVMAYNLTKDQIATLMKQCPQCDYRYVETWTDFIAIPSSLVIADMSDMNEEDKRAVFNFYKDIEPSPEHIIITNGIDGNQDPKIRSVEVINDFWDDERRIRTVMLSILHDTARDVDFSRRLSLALNIQKMICKNPGISSKKMAKALELSERSIRRYIDTLRMAGALIEYRDKGWFCEWAVWD